MGFRFFKQRLVAPAVIPGAFDHIVSAHLVAEVVAHLAVLKIIADASGDIGPEEDEEVGQGQHRRHLPGEGLEQNRRGKNHPVQIAQVFNLDRNNHHKEDFFIWEKGGVGQEEGKMQVGGACEAHNESPQHSPDGPQKVVKGELKIPPGIFQAAANPVIEVQHQRHGKGPSAVIHKKEGNKTPYLAL